MSFILYQKLIKLFLISFWNIHDFIFKIIFNNWLYSKQMSFFHSDFMYAVNNNLIVLKSSSIVVIMTFFIHNSKESFEIIVQKQFFVFNVSIILIVKFSFDLTIFAIVDFLFKMMRVDFFLFLFFFVDALKANSNFEFFRLSDRFDDSKFSIFHEINVFLKS